MFVEPVSLDLGRHLGGDVILHIALEANAMVSMSQVCVV